MRADLDEKAKEVAAVVSSVPDWARSHPDIDAVALVGSWVRQAAQVDSDVDLIVLTSDPSAYIERDDWARAFGVARFAKTRPWGRITERRGVTASGLEIEFGITSDEWANVEPVDPGTLQVVTDGMAVLYDRNGRLATLVHSVQSKP